MPLIALNIMATREEFVDVLDVLLSGCGPNAIPRITCFILETCGTKAPSSSSFAIDLRSLSHIILPTIIITIIFHHGEWYHKGRTVSTRGATASTTSTVPC
jgi:hypothetical protein